MKTSLTLAKAGGYLALFLVLAACGDPTPTATPEAGPPKLDQVTVVWLAWAALEPNTASHDRANWAEVEARQVLGGSVGDEFEGWVFYGSCGGPAPPPNREIEAVVTYWYVVMEPQPATPSGPPVSPKGPPQVPEPSIARAAFLIDKRGQVIARVLTCIEY